MSDDNTPGQAPQQPAPDYPAAAPQPPAYTPPPGQAPAYGQPPAYGQTPSYGQAPAYGAYGQAAPAKTNTLAVVSLISSIAAFVVLPFVASIVAVITGHMALGQIKKTGEQGHGMALAGTIIGWVGIALAVLGLIVLIAFIPLFLEIANNPAYRA